MSEYLVKATGRVVTLTKYLGDKRWLCTDANDKSHPCYNESDLSLLLPKKITPRISLLDRIRKLYA